MRVIQENWQISSRLELGDLELSPVEAKLEASHTCTSRILARVADTECKLQAGRNPHLGLV